MKLYVVLTLLVSFAALAVFGFAMMSADGGHMGCIAAMAQGADCPRVVDMVLLHLNAFNLFSSAIFGQSVLFLILALGVFTLLILAAVLGGHFAFLPIGGDYPARFFDPPRLTFGNRLNRWLSLLETSPTAP